MRKVIISLSVLFIWIMFIVFVTKEYPKDIVVFYAHEKGCGRSIVNIKHKITLGDMIKMETEIEKLNPEIGKVVIQNWKEL